MYDLKIANGSIVTAESVSGGDVLIKDGKIAVVGGALKDKARETIDAKGKLLFPGMIDCHVHLNDPGFTWREDYPHGSAAAAVGGVTTILDMPLQNSPALTNAAVFAAKEKIAASRSHVDYAFWGGLVDDNTDQLSELAGAGVIGFKAFLGPVSPDYSSVDLGLVRRALSIAKEAGVVCGFHCEDYAIINGAEKQFAHLGKKATWTDFLASRPLSAEIIATRAIVELARETGARVHICHVSHPDVAEIIRTAKREGVAVSGETCSHYLTFSEGDVIEQGALFKCAPPLRSVANREALWEYVLDGTLASLASDHSPCSDDEKDESEHGVFGAWGGISGIQNLLQVCYDQGVNKRGYTPCFLARASQETARIFSLVASKGAIKTGLDADIVILDPKKSWTITPQSLKYRNQISAFTELKGKGLPVCTLVRGCIVARNGDVTRMPGHGRLLKTAVE